MRTLRTTALTIAALATAACAHAAQPAPVPVSALLSPGAPAPEIACEHNPENLATYLALHDALFNKRESTRASEFYADAFITHDTDMEASHAGEVRTPEYMAAMWEGSKRASPDRWLDPQLILCAGDMVIARTVSHGTRLIEPGNPDAGGKPYRFTATDIYRFRDGKVVERWGNADTATVMRQIGDLLFPPKTGD